MHVPGWHETTQQLVEEGRIQVLGIVQEQHGDRARLFMQWQEMGWPVLVDSLNLLGVEVVPITLLIDEHGVVRSVRPSPEAFQELLETSYPPPAEAPAATPAVRGDLDRLAKAARGQDAGAQRLWADALVLWGEDEQLDQAVQAYEMALKADPGDGVTHFRLGVAYRKRYDSEHRQPNDFARAVEHWGQALEAQPNQYIWRRRIQQYGPRLAKPYPFYDWVEKARSEVAARGEVPVELVTEPGGAEIARPVKSFEVEQAEVQNPDPRGRIRRDQRGFIVVETAVVPAVVEAGGTARVHVAMRPNEKTKAHWNNEAEDLVFWIDAPEGFAVSRRHHTVAIPAEATSDELRKVEFEIRTADGFSGTVELPAYALYYVCEDVDRTCLFRRQDVVVRLRSAAGEKASAPP